MSNILPKYLIFGASDIDQLNRLVNKRADEGYKHQDTKPYQGIGGTVFVVTMYLSSTPDIQNGVDFVNMEKDTNNVNGSSLIKKMTDAGWVPISEYSKHVTLMKLKEINNGI